MQILIICRLTDESAFIERKQAEINENNVREFCNVIDCNQGNYREEVNFF